MQVKSSEGQTRKQQMFVHPQPSLLSVLPNARTREPLGEGEAKSRSVGKTDAGKEERAETVSDSSSTAVDSRQACSSHNCT